MHFFGNMHNIVKRGQHDLAVFIAFSADANLGLVQQLSLMIMAPCLYLQFTYLPLIRSLY